METKSSMKFSDAVPVGSCPIIASFARMKWSIIFLSVVAMTSAQHIHGQSAFMTAKMEIRIDLDSDGKVELVTLKKHGADESGKLYHMIVYKLTGKTKAILWEDKARKHEFYRGDFGEGGFVCGGDIDADGFLDVVTQAPQSDVSPTFYEIFSWRKDHFEKSAGAFYVGKIVDADDMIIEPEFIAMPAVDALDYSKTIVWISAIKKIPAAGMIDAVVFASNGMWGKALFRRVGAGFRIERWGVRMKRWEE